MNPYLTILVTLCCAAFFSGLEIAFVSANKLRIELEKSKGSYTANLVGRFVKHPSRFIGAMLVGNNIALVVYGIAASALLEPVLKAWLPAGFDHDTLVLIIQTIVSTLVILVVAEFMPKILFRLNPNGLMNFFAIPAAIAYGLLYPFMYLFISFSEWLLRTFFGMKNVQKGYRFSAVDFDEYLNDLNRKESIEEEVPEIQMIQNVRGFHTAKVRECMVPRNEIAAADVSWDFDRLTAFFEETQHSKIPVYSGSIDNITGYAHIYDLFDKPRMVTDIVRPVLMLPETIVANRVLQMMLEQRKSVSIILDEFGGTAGMVTVEDLIEEIFGEIDDEYDVDEFVEKQKNENEYVFAGRLEIDYLNQEYSLELPVSDEYETLAGLIINHHHSIPHRQEIITIGHFEFTILEASQQRIEKVLLKVKG